MYGICIVGCRWNQVDETHILNGTHTNGTHIALGVATPTKEKASGVTTEAYYPLLREEFLLPINEFSHEHFLF